MNYTKKAALECFEECKKLLTKHTLPSWDELPSIDLYMDQVIELVNSYIGNLELLSSDGVEITRPMINNYVKLKMMPAPVKKKYGKVHLAYIIVICTLKQSLNISTIQKILPNDIPNDAVEYIYNSFVKNQKAAFEYASEQADRIAGPIVITEEGNPQRIDDLIMQIASSTNILKCLTEKVVNFQGVCERISVNSRKARSSMIK